MPDPEMVARAHRAAAMLERAWDRWRSAYGIASGPMPPISSYVGYSIEEPWGRPRVVFGVDAREAEHLAALLDNYTPDDFTGDGPLPVEGPAGEDSQWPEPGPPPGGQAEQALGVRARIPAQAPAAEGMTVRDRARRQQAQRGGNAATGAAAAAGESPSRADEEPDWPGQEPAGGGVALAGLGGKAAGIDPDDSAAADPGVDVRDADQGPAAARGGAGFWAEDGPSGTGSSWDAAAPGEQTSGGRDDPAGPPGGAADPGDGRHCTGAGKAGAGRPQSTRDADPLQPGGAGQGGPRPAGGADGAAGAGRRRGSHDAGAVQPTGADGAAGAGRPRTSRDAGPAASGGAGHGAPPDLPARDPAERGPHAEGPRAEGPRTHATEPPDWGRADGGSRPEPLSAALPPQPPAAPPSPPVPLSAPPPLPGEEPGAQHRPARAVSSASIAAELAGWAAGELPGQASARLAAWATVGGLPARGQGTRTAGGMTARGETGMAS